MTEKIPVTVRFAEEVVELIDDSAKLEAVSRSDFIRLAVVERLKKIAKREG